MKIEMQESSLPIKHQNRMRLESNQAQALEFTNSVINNNETANQVFAVNALEGIPYEDFDEVGITDLCNRLDAKRDFEKGIIRYEKIHDDGTISLVRDARNYKLQSRESENLDINAMYMQMLSTTRAALYMIDDQVKDEEFKNLIKTRLYKLINFELKNIKSNNIENLSDKLKTYNAKVLDVLEQSLGFDHKRLKDSLGLTMHAMNFNNKDYHITTINNIKASGVKATVVESDILMLGVTDEQKKQLIALKNNDEEVLKNVSWYKKLSPYKQRLARYCAEQMLDDSNEVVKKVPTQLRNLIPFGKNMYTKFTHVKTSNEELKLVSENAHTGAIYYGSLSKDMSEVKEMAQQIQTFAPSRNVKINQIMTISPNNIFNSVERKAYTQTKEAMKATGNTYSTTPFNLFRKFSSRDKNGHNKILNSLGDITHKFYPYGRTDKIRKYLKGTFLSSKAEAINATKQCIEDLDKKIKSGHKDLTADYKLKKAFFELMLTAIEARSLLATRLPFYEVYGNNNLELTRLFSELNTSIHGKDSCIREFVYQSKDLVLVEKFEEIPYIVVSCMSGKDRTGVAMFVTTVSSIFKFIVDKFGFSNIGTKDLQDIASKINHAGHTQMIPSQNDIGTYGVKKSTRPAEISKYLSNDTLSLDSASTNKFTIKKGVKVNLDNLDNIEAHKFDKEISLKKKSLIELEDKTRVQATVAKGRMNDHNSKLESPMRSTERLKLSKVADQIMLIG